MPPRDVGGRGAESVLGARVDALRDQQPRDGEAADARGDVKRGVLIVGGCESRRESSVRFSVSKAQAFRKLESWHCHVAHSLASTSARQSMSRETVVMLPPSHAAWRAVEPS